MRAALNRLAKAAARRLLAWVARRGDSTQQTWLEALRAELDVIDGGIAQLVWAVGGLRLIWLDRRQHMVGAGASGLADRHECRRCCPHDAAMAGTHPGAEDQNKVRHDSCGADTRI